MPVSVHSMCEPLEMEKSLTFDPRACDKGNKGRLKWSCN
uniref:Uncharacterized protein n=1 Tax=Anguilla anguilla TaxID=7936 RepID=A0A0E9VS15_ANGAN